MKILWHLMKNGLTETKAVFVARDNQQLIGVAGAAESSMDGVWEIGIDVKEEYRKKPDWELV